ncbi:MAG: 50S ribosomal protein L29 [Patescibacteria group bacterium]
MKKTVQELRAQSIKDLLKVAKQDTERLTKISFELGLGKTSTIKDIRQLKKHIARTQTIISEKLREVEKKS